MVSAELGYEKKRLSVEGREMAYIEAGSGDPIVFLHGNPTSSYLWRNVIPHLEGLGRCIAADMIGMGDSDKLPDSGPDSYRFVEHRKYLYGLLDRLGVGENVVLVGHDWGGAFAFHWAQRNAGAVQGIAYMETIIQPLTWADWPEAARGVFHGFRSPAGEEMVLEKNIFVEAVLPRSIIRKLGEAEMDAYRAPYLEPRGIAAADLDLATRDTDRGRARRCAIRSSPTTPIGFRRRKSPNYLSGATRAPS